MHHRVEPVEPAPPAADVRRLRSTLSVLTALAAVVVATFVVLAGPASTASGQQAPAGTIRLITPTNPVLKGDPATVGGRFDRGARRTVVIESAAVGSSSWTRLAGSRQTTTSTGTYRHRFTPAATRKYRAVVLATTRKPRQVSNQTTVTVVRGWRSVTSGPSNTCGLRHDRTTFCWGANQYGELGNPTNNGTTAGVIVPQKLPVPVAGQWWRALTFGEGHVCGLLSNNSGWCWGLNNAGQLGTSTNVGTNDPNPAPLPLIAPGGRTWLSLSAGSDFTCGLTTDRALWCWGSNKYGGLGVATNNGSSNANPAPIQVPSPAPGTTTWRQVDASRAHTCGTLTTGGLWCWGYALDGRLGPNVTPADTTHLPAEVDTPTTNWTTTATGSLWSCGLTSTSRLRCWGNNRFGSLGTATNAGTDTPHPTPIAAPAPANGTVSALRVGGGFTCATLTDTTSWCWGSNQYGTLATVAGSGSTTPMPDPVKLPRNYRGLSAGASHACGLTSKHTLECWGSNVSGQLGRADNVNMLVANPTPKAVPVPQ